MNKQIFCAVLILFYACIGYAQDATDTNSTITEQTNDADNALVHKKFEAIKNECTKIADTATQEIFKDFEPQQFATNHKYKVNNAVTRVWYNSFLNAFKKNWKKQLEDQVTNKQITLEQYAQIAFEVRHHARITIRDHMSDNAGLAAIRDRDLKVYGNPDGPTFKSMIERRLEKQKAEADPTYPNLDKAYRSIIDTSTKTNKLVNTFIKCYSYARESWCNYIGDSLAAYMDTAL